MFDKEVTVNECTCIKYRNYTMSITTVIMQSNKCSYSLCPEQNRQKIVKVHIKMNFINCFIKLYRPVVFNTKQNMTRAKKKIKNNAPSSVISNNVTRLQLFILMSVRRICKNGLVLIERRSDPKELSQITVHSTPSLLLMQFQSV